MDPQVPKERIPSYEKVEEKIRELDGTVIILRVFYSIENISYKFQLLKNNKMCSVEIPRKLLEELRNGDAEKEEELTLILKTCLKESSS
jgi:5,10-methylenetetrahydrofolate reductase